MITTGPHPGTDPPSGPYRDTCVAVGTRHGKQHQFHVPFRAVLGAHLLTPPDLDTDQFGTFSGEMPRTTTAVAAARAKAHLAMSVTGLPFGLSSEASYGAFGRLGWSGHQEVLLFCDAERGIEVLVGHRTLEVPGHPRRVRRVQDVPPALLDGLPEQALIVRPAEPGGEPAITKGIADPATLATAIAHAATYSADRHAIVEPDLRAHHNPSRQRVLVLLADSLARRLATPCPACRAPGFGRVDTERGLPCRDCGTPTLLAITEILGCAACDHRQSRPLAGARADPVDCPRCNP